MKTILITGNEAGQRLDKFLLKYLNLAPSSLIHKFLRKKDIRLNGKRSDGSERLKEGDEVQIRLPDGTVAGLIGQKAVRTERPHIHVIYEDENVLLLDKPAGVLTQKAGKKDLSLNEEMLSYLLDTGSITPESLSFFKPAVCNRLDRNTSGIVLAAKTLPAARELNSMIRGRRLRKLYLCLVKGSVHASLTAEGWLIKDERSNKAQILDAPAEGAVRIMTNIRPLEYAGGLTLLEVDLITGKTHQIRAQMSYLGYPVAGDTKYGGSFPGAGRQMLCAYSVTFPQEESGCLSCLSGRTFTAALPADFRRLMKAAGMRTVL